MKLSEGKIVRVTSTPFAFVHIARQLAYMKERGVNIELVSERDEKFSAILEMTHCPFVAIEICREINLLKDLKSVWLLFRYLRKTRPSIVHSSTPKAGLICAIAAFMARVPVRLHTFTGQRWASLSKKSLLRLILVAADRLIVSLNTFVYSDSESQNNYLVQQGIVGKDKIRTLHKGCYGGIDFERFDWEKMQGSRTQVFKELGLSPDTRLVLFLGRVTKEKGIEELLDVFSEQEFIKENIHLLVVGPREQKLDPISSVAEQSLLNSKHIHYIDFTNSPQKYYSAADLFCMPSYREGFGTVILEAAAFKLPSIGTNIPGLQDAIVHNQTGILYNREETQKLKEALLELCRDDNRRKAMGENAYQRALKDFNYKIIAEAQILEYERLVNEIK